MTRYVITVSKDVVVECEDDEALIHQASIKKLVEEVESKKCWLPKYDIGMTDKEIKMEVKSINNTQWNTTIKEVIDSKQSKLI